MQRLKERLIGFSLCRSDPGVSRLAVCKDEQGIVGGGITVNGNHVKGLVHDGADRLLEDRSLHGCVRCHIAQHGAHIGMDHTGTLGHAADRHLLPVDFKGAGALLFMCIRCHDGLCGIRSVVQVFSEVSRQGFNTCADPVNGELKADNSGGTHEDRVRGYPQGGSRRLRSLQTVVQTCLAGAGVGDPGVYDHGVHRFPAPHKVAVPDHRRRLDDIPCKGSRCRAGRGAVDHRHICPALILDLRSCRCSRKALCGCHAA